MMASMRAGLRDDERGVTLIELLVVILIIGVVMGATYSIIISTERSNQFQQTMQQVVDDGRIALSRIRKELRSARRVFATSGADRLHFWVDANQDAIPQADEQICYAVEPISAARWQITRWTHATGDCVPGAPPAGATPQLLAQTLTDPGPFTLYDPVPSFDINDPATRVVRIELELEVESVRSHSINVEATVRLRNVA